MCVVMFDGNNLLMRLAHIKDVKTVDSDKKVIGMDYQYLEYCFFNSIYLSLQKVKNAKELIIAVDDKRSWRYSFWKRYKEDRKNKRLESTDNFPFDELFEKYENMLKSISSHFPVKVVKVDGAEGDDVIGHLALTTSKKVNIISTDKDYTQLYSDRVSIYDPMKQSYITHPDPELFLVEQCLIGQSKDSIFNILTPLDHPADKRKPGFGPKAFEKAMEIGKDEFLDSNNLRERYNFNYKLISFTEIPQEVCDRIDKEYSSITFPDPSMMWEYIREKNWPNEMDNFTQIENRFLELY